MIQSNQVLTVAGCQRATEAADILCSYSGFTNKVSYVNPATSLPWTVVDMFSDLLAQGPIAASTRHDLADTSGLPRWPVMPFVQPLNDDTDGDGLSDEWERYFFGNLNATATNSASGDGVANLFKYALHLDPTVPGTMGFPKFALTNSAANYTYCRARPELGYAVESSTNLFLWNTNGVNQGQGTNVSTTASVPVSTTPSRFFRLRVNAN